MPPDAPPPVSGAVALVSEDWEPVVSSRFGVEVPLPQRSSWLVNDKAQPWLVAQHAPSRSELRIRVWRQPRPVRLTDCEDQVDLWRPEFQATTEDSELERSPWVPDAQFRGTVRTVVTRLDSGRVEGRLRAVAASPNRCLSLLYRTQVAGQGGEAIVGDNLAIIAAGVASRIQLRSIDDVGSATREGL